MKLAPLSIVLLLAAGPAGAQVFVDIGAQRSEIRSIIAGRPGSADTTEQGVHLGVGFRREFGDRHTLAAKLEWNDLGPVSMLAVRAVDYRRRFGSRFSVGGFIGAARLDLATPALGYYFGMGLRIEDLMPGWDLTLDLHYADKAARDNLLPSDPQAGTDDNFHDVDGASLYLSYRF